MSREIKKQTMGEHLSQQEMQDIVTLCIRCGSGTVDVLPKTS